MTNVSKVFAERLKELREEQKLSVSELAKRLNVSPIAISRWENQKRTPNIDTLFLIANFFGVSADYLIGIEN